MTNYSIVTDSNQLAPTSSRSIGELLVASGKLTPEQADQILAFQQKSGKPFGEAAVELKLIDRDDLQLALAKQYNYLYLTQEDSAVSKELVTAYRPFSKFGEEIRALRTQLALKWFGDDPLKRTLSIVSPQAGDGKSFLAANLAIAFAQQGVRTLLIDADLRLPRLDALFKLTRSPGLSAVLSERVSVSSAIEKVASFPDLSILPSGPVPPNPPELLSRPAFAGVLMHAATNYDVVLIDTPACDRWIDAEIISKRSGAALVVSRQNETSLKSYSDLVKSLREGGVAVVGAVLNDR